MLADPATARPAPTGPKFVATPVGDQVPRTGVSTRPASADPAASAASSAPDTATEGYPIGRVLIHTRNIFEPVPPGRAAIFYRMANRLHFRTRSVTVHDKLLFGPGEPWSGARGRETARNLRALDFLAPSEISARREGDSVAVRVETRDVWSTRPEFDLQSSGGRRYGAVAFTESNFAGLGKSISVVYRGLPEGHSHSVSYSDPGVLGSRARLHYAASSGGSGASDEVSLGVPFFSEDTPRAYGLSWSRGTSVLSLFSRGSEVASLNRKIEETEAYWGMGRREDGVIARVTASYLIHDRRLGPSLILSPAPAEFAGGEESELVRRVSIEGRLWKPRFIERTRVNGYGLVEDFDVGTSLALTAGVGPRIFGSTRDEGYGRARLDAGTETPFGFGLLHATISTRLPRQARETIAQLDARWVRQGRTVGTFVASATGIAGLRTARDFQATVGGLNGLRAYDVHAVSGTRLWRLNAEERWTVGENYWESLTVGAVIFTDAARAWGPGSGGSEWFTSAGTGLRLALPQWSLGQVLRMDLAWPIQPTRDGKRQPVFSFGSSQAF